MISYLSENRGICSRSVKFAIFTSNYEQAVLVSDVVAHTLYWSDITKVFLSHL